MATYNRVGGNAHLHTIYTAERLHQYFTDIASLIAYYNKRWLIQ